MGYSAWQLSRSPVHCTVYSSWQAAGVALEVAPRAGHSCYSGCWGQHVLTLSLLWCLENQGFYKPGVQTASLGSICFKVFEFSATVIRQIGLGETACEQLLSVKDVLQGLVEPGWEDKLGPT